LLQLNADLISISRRKKRVVNPTIPDRRKACESMYVLSLSATPGKRNGFLRI